MTCSPDAVDSSALRVFGVRKTPTGPELVGGAADLGHEVAAQLADLGITGATDEVRRISAGDAGVIAIVGLGSAEIDVTSLRYAAGSAVRQLVGVPALCLCLPTTTPQEASAVLEGAALASYAFTSYRHSSLADLKVPATSISVCTTQAVSADDVTRVNVVSRAVHHVLDLVNTPAREMFPESFAESVLAESADAPVVVTVLDEAGLHEGGFGGILGVGAGSSRGPRLVKMVYAPENATSHIALVGKGITFDTGGLSLKPAGSMVGMKYDMTGAATVQAVVLAVARLGLPVALTGWLCLAENMPSGTAIRPNDVLRIRGGKTVEVLNTDAEGRLVLADGLVAASEEQPDAIIDVATLTGAAVVALGERYTGVMGDDTLVSRVTSAAKRVGEPMWGMPLPEEHRALLTSDIADIANVKMGNSAGGMLVAGTFLKEFVGTREGDSSSQIPWAHLDIAGPSDNSGAGYGFTGKGPTGVAVRTLIELAEEFSRA